MLKIQLDDEDQLKTQMLYLGERVLQNYCCLREMR